MTFLPYPGDYSRYGNMGGGSWNFLPSPYSTAPGLAGLTSPQVAMPITAAPLSDPTGINSLLRGSGGADSAAGIGYGMGPMTAGDLSQAGFNATNAPNVAVNTANVPGTWSNITNAAMNVGRMMTSPISMVLGPFTATPNVEKSAQALNQVSQVPNIFSWAYNQVFPNTPQAQNPAAIYATPDEFNPGMISAIPEGMNAAAMAAPAMDPGDFAAASAAAYGSLEAGAAPQGPETGISSSGFAVGDIGYAGGTPTASEGAGATGSAGPGAGPTGSAAGDLGQEGGGAFGGGGGGGGGDGGGGCIICEALFRKKLVPKNIHDAAEGNVRKLHPRVLRGYYRWSPWFVKIINGNNFLAKIIAIGANPVIRGMAQQRGIAFNIWKNFCYMIGEKKHEKRFSFAY